MPREKVPDQVAHYLRFCGYRDEAGHSGQVDLSKCEFIFPTTLLPLSGFATKEGWDLLIDPKTKSGGYLMYMLKTRSDGALRAPYVALITLPKKQEDCQTVLDGLNSLGAESLLYRDNHNMFAYVLGELIDNIYQHSEFTYASVMAQKYGQRGFIELCFFGDGITIPGSFERHGKSYTSHSRAIYDAISGVSTKKEKGRGYGLSTNVDMFRDLGVRCLSCLDMVQFTSINLSWSLISSASIICYLV